MTEPLKVGIIGYGKRGAVHAEVWASIPDVELVAIADLDEHRRISAIYQFFGGNGNQGFVTGETMLQAVPLDIVVVATQPQQHYANVRLAIRHGCHVICEKPLALTLEEADAMIEAAEAAGVKFAIHHQTVFSKTVRRAEEMLAAGEIGELKRVSGWCKGRPAAYDLMEVGGHVLDLLWHFAGGRPVEVFGRALLKGKPVLRADAISVEKLYPQGGDMGVGGGDYLFGSYHFASGVHGTFEAMTVPEGRRDTQYMTTELVGTEGRLRFQHSGTGRLFRKRTPYDDFAGTLAGWEEVSPELWEDDRQWRGPTRRFAEDFIVAIQEGRSPKMPATDGRVVLEMTLGIYASHLAGRPLKLPLEERKHPLR